MKEDLKLLDSSTIPVIQKVAEGTTVGRKRILEVPETISGTLRIRIPDSITNAPSLKAVHLFLR